MLLELMKFKINQTIRVKSYENTLSKDGSARMEPITGNAFHIKRMNTNLVRSAIQRMKTATKLELAQITTLTTVTVGTILNELVSTGEVSLGNLIPSQGGRPSRQYNYNEDFTKVCVIFASYDQGIPAITAQVVNQAQQVLHQESVQLAQPLIFDFFLLLDKAVKVVPDIKAIGFSLPGIIYQDRMTSDYHHLNGEEFLETFRQRYSVPVYFENLVNAACFGYCRMHAEPAPESVLYVHFMDNHIPRSAFFCNGKIWQGNHNMAGQIGAKTFDIPWKDDKFNLNQETFVTKMTYFLAALSTAIYPEKIVLSGHPLLEDSILQISQGVSERLERKPGPSTTLTASFEKDLQTGIIEITSDALYSNS